MNPSVVFCGVFFFSSIVCYAASFFYTVSLFWVTPVVLIIGYSVMTFCNYLSRHRLSTQCNNNKTAEVINLPIILIAGLIIMQILSILFFVNYLHELTTEYNRFANATVPQSFSEMVNLYDTLTKFWTGTFAQLNVRMPMLYRICNPLCLSAEYIVLYVAVNNFVTEKRVNLAHVVVLLLMTIRIVMNGSRSPLFRIFTFVLILYYIINCKHDKSKRGSIKSLITILGSVMAFAVVMFLALVLMGRTDKMVGAAQTLFIYLGAPLLNLNSFLRESAEELFFGVSKDGPPGGHVFSAIYTYLGRHLGIPEYMSIKPIGKFIYAVPEIETGNVFTIYYSPIYDFGIVGMAILLMIMGIYYCYTYRRFFGEKETFSIININLLIYAYLFNDIIMSFFSNRFYETTFNPLFIKFALVAWIIDVVFIENDITLLGRRTKILRPTILCTNTRKGF